MGFPRYGVDANAAWGSVGLGDDPGVIKATPICMIYPSGGA
jgi:hypothetical protein